MGTCLHQEYAYTPRQGPNSRGRNHLVTEDDFELGRIRRKERDPLCKPRSKFWGLSRQTDDVPFDDVCKRCVEIARRLEAANLICLCEEPDGPCDCGDPHAHTCIVCDEEWCQGCWEGPAHEDSCPTEERNKQLA